MFKRHGDIVCAEVLAAGRSSLNLQRQQALRLYVRGARRETGTAQMCPLSASHMIGRGGFMARITRGEVPLSSVSRPRCIPNRQAHPEDSSRLGAVDGGYRRPALSTLQLRHVYCRFKADEWALA